ncbi:hypothetical protein GCM10022404_22940 [Celeribacter arenosi]|uniref:Uncharacterized protein n=1 Tax=Celeribacter arenosi TaxID=792649 RepID=A0ABP7KBW0_9RHOB
MVIGQKGRQRDAQFALFGFIARGQRHIEGDHARLDFLGVADRDLTGLGGLKTRGKAGEEAHTGGILRLCQLT